MKITSELLTKAIESFPLAGELPPNVPQDLGALDSAIEALREDYEFAHQFNGAIQDNDAFNAFTAQMRELYFQHGMQAWAFINIMRCCVQLGYRMHSLEMVEGFAEE